MIREARLGLGPGEPPSTVRLVTRGEIPARRVIPNEFIEGTEFAACTSELS